MSIKIKLKMGQSSVERGETGEICQTGETGETRGSTLSELSLTFRSITLWIFAQIQEKILETIELDKLMRH